LVEATIPKYLEFGGLVGKPDHLGPAVLERESPMKKKVQRRLTLSRETLKQLDDPRMDLLQGGSGHSPAECGGVWLVGQSVQNVCGGGGTGGTGTKQL